MSKKWTNLVSVFVDRLSYFPIKQDDARRTKCSSSNFPLYTHVCFRVFLQRWAQLAVLFALLRHHQGEHAGCVKREWGVKCESFCKITVREADDCGEERKRKTWWANILWRSFYNSNSKSKTKKIHLLFKLTLWVWHHCRRKRAGLHQASRAQRTVCGGRESATTSDLSVCEREIACVCVCVCVLNLRGSVFLKIIKSHLKQPSRQSPMRHNSPKRNTFPIT